MITITTSTKGCRIDLNALLKMHCYTSTRLQEICGAGTRSDTKSKVEMEQPRREKEVVALENYVKLVEYLLPTDGSLMRSYLCHCDLHSENMYVNPNKPEEIVE